MRLAGVVHEIDTRNRQTGAIGQLGHRVDELGGCLLVDLMGAVRGQNKPIALPVSKEIRRGSNEEGNRGATPPPSR